VLVAGLVAGLVGASIFLYLPLRYAAQPAFNYAGHYDATGMFIPVNLQTLDGFLWLVTGRGFAGLMFGYRLTELWPQVHLFAEQLWSAFFILGIGPGILGLIMLLRRDWRVGVMLLLMFLANAVFYINYRVIDKNTMFLPTYLIWALWLGVGYEALLKWMKRDVASPPLSGLVRGLLVGVVVLAIGRNWSLVDLSEDWSTREQSEAILAEVEPNALVFGWWDTVPGLQYLQLVEGQRPDVRVINRFLIGGEEMHQLILRELGRRPLYINAPSVELLKAVKATPAGPLYRLEPRQSLVNQE
jgi:hypothetical protein